MILFKKGLFIALNVVMNISEKNPKISKDFRGAVGFFLVSLSVLVITFSKFLK